MEEDSPMTNTLVFKKIKESRGGHLWHVLGHRVYLPCMQSCCDQGVESGSYATHSRFDNSRKQLEVALIRGQDDNKEILVSLRLMKVWDVVHMSFPRVSDTFC